MPKQSPRKNSNWFLIERIAHLLSEETGESADALEQDLEKWNSDFIRQKESTITETSDDDGETTRLLCGSLFGQIQRKVLEAYCSDRGYKKPSLWLTGEVGRSKLSGPSVVEARLAGPPAREARPVQSVDESSFESSSVAPVKQSYPVKEAKAAAEASNAEMARQKPGAEAKAERHKLIRAAETASAEAVALREQLETARQQIANLNSAAESSNAETARLGEQLAAAQRELETARQKPGAEAKAERHKLIRAAETASAEAVALREQLETARQQIANLNSAAERRSVSESKSADPATKQSSPMGVSTRRTDITGTQAQHNVGEHIECGIPRRDDAQAEESYRKAASQGLAEAQYQLATILAAEAMAGQAKIDETETGIRFVEAYMWLLLAEGQGHELASNSMKQLEQHMTEEQLVQAGNMVQHWRSRLEG